MPTEYFHEDIGDLPATPAKPNAEAQAEAACSGAAVQHVLNWFFPTPKFRHIYLGNWEGQLTQRNIRGLGRTQRLFTGVFDNYTRYVSGMIFP